MSDKNNLAPQIGQFVWVRDKAYIVNDVNVSKETQRAQTKVTLECVDNNKLGETFDAIWELENNNTKEVFDEDTFPDASDFKFDPPEMIEALKHAVLWSSPSVIGGPKLRAPFMGAIQIEDYQLEPVARAMRLPRVNLLIADDVGLGKTIEAGLIIHELMANGRVKKILVVTPASLTMQWQTEMAEKFQLDFKIIDRDYLLNLRREYGTNANPFTSYPRLIISMDYFKREQIKTFFEQSLMKNSGMRNWDMLILDEAHNTAPAGRQNYVRDSERTKLLQFIAPHFEHRVFLTATPHNGFTYSFTALLELLDPLRFNRGPSIDSKQLSVAMIRRLKSEVSSNKNFARRNIDKLEVNCSEREAGLFSALNKYIEMRLKNSETSQITFAMTLLKKRLLSSPLAFKRSLEWHTYAAGEIMANEISDNKLLERITQLALEDYSDDIEKQEHEELAVKEVTRSMKILTAGEKKLLDELNEYSEQLSNDSDSKLESLMNFIKRQIYINGRWTDERLIIFTEYKDTLEYLQSKMSEFDDGERILTLTGGISNAEREKVKNKFQSPPSETKSRILIATDAASEGLNLQNYCRYLIHYEIPWNPNKMEQRNGRIDRHGQKAEEVGIFHFLYNNQEDSRFLEILIEKVRTMREDMGAIGDIVEKSIEKAMLGQSKTFEFDDKRRNIIREDIKREISGKFKYEELMNELNESKNKLQITAESVKNLVDCALKLNNCDLIKPADDVELKKIGGVLKRVPARWEYAKKFLKDKNGNMLKLIFEPNACLERKDIVQIHLGQPLIKCAISEFRRELFGRGSKMSRVTYKVVDGIKNIVLKASTRVIVSGGSGNLLHEEIIDTAGEVNENSFTAYGVEAKSKMDEIEKMEYSFDEIPAALANKLRLYAGKHKRRILDELEKRVEARAAVINKALNDRAEADIKIFGELISERIKELQKRLKDINEKTGEEYLQLSLFTEEEKNQFNENVKWLEYRLDDLKRRKKEEPAAIAERYKAKGIKAFFLSLSFYIPRN